MTERSIPDGFTHNPVETTASGRAYKIECLQATSLDVPDDFDASTLAPLYPYLAFYAAEGKNGPEIIRDILNAANEQGAKQGPKAPVRDAIDSGKSEEEISAAIVKAQEDAKFFVIGAPRGGGGPRHESGLTKKQRENLGTAVAMEMATTGKPPSQKRLEEICGELNIDPALLGS